jgi:hypothetical protein
MDAVDRALELGVRRAVRMLRNGAGVHEAEVCLLVAGWTAELIEAKGAP